MARPVAFARIMGVNQSLPMKRFRRNLAAAYILLPNDHAALDALVLSCVTAQIVAVESDGDTVTRLASDAQIRELEEGAFRARSTPAARVSNAFDDTLPRSAQSENPAYRELVVKVTEIVNNILTEKGLI